MSNHKLTKKELNAISWRYILGSQLNWNYERMMSSGYLYGILPVLKKFYGHDEAQFQDMMRTHNQFFNTNAIFGNLIMGIDVAIEEQDGYKAKETIIALKTALMGSLAGVGELFIPRYLGDDFRLCCRDTGSKWFGGGLCYLDYCKYCTIVWSGRALTTWL